MIDGAGIAGLVVIALMFQSVTEFSSFLYRGGFAVLGLGSVLAVAALAHPASRLGPIVGCKPMRWIGERSYGIYLWTLPIIVLTSPQGAYGPDPLRAVLQVAAIIGVAELSWRYVENPIRHGALGRFLADWRAGRWRRERLSRHAWALVSAGGVVIAFAAAGLGWCQRFQQTTNAIAPRTWRRPSPQRVCGIPRLRPPAKRWCTSATRPRRA